MKIEAIYKYFLINPVQLIPVVDSDSRELVGLLSKEKILHEMSDLSQSGKEYEKIPSHLFVETFNENLITYFQNNRVVPVLSLSGEKVAEWDKPRFLAEFSKSFKKEEEKITPEKNHSISEEDRIQWFTSLILENFPDPLFATDVDGNSIFYNEKFENEILKNKNFRNSIVFAERFLRDLNRDLFASYLKANDFENSKEKFVGQFIQAYVRQLDRILRVVTLQAKDKTVGFLYQFIQPGNKLSVMGNSGMSFPSLEEAFHEMLPLEVVLSETESHYIYYKLKKNQNNISHTAKELGIPRSTLQNRIRQLSIEKKFEKNLKKDFKNENSGIAEPARSTASKRKVAVPKKSSAKKKLIQHGKKEKKSKKKLTTNRRKKY